MLELKNVYVNYGKRDIIKNISFSLYKGETLSIIGPSGCGKSTLLLAIAKLNEISKGEIVDTFNDSGLILQNNSLFPWKTIRKNIELGLTQRSIDKNKIDEIVYSVSEKLKITHILDKLPSQVSGGEKQRASVARILSFKPQLLLMDEPTSALDSINKENFQNVLLDIQNKYNIASIIVTHNIEEAVILGKNIAIMNDGEIIKIIKNPYYGQAHIRKSYEIFNKCNEIRSYLEELGEK